MSPKSIARLRGLLSMMDANERQVLRNYLQCFESRKKGHKPKTLILLDLLEKYPDDTRVEQLLRKKVTTEDARRMVVKRLYDKMVASLTLDVNLSRPQTYDDIAQARASVAQGKIIAQLLIARGQRETGLRELERSIDTAKRYELFHDLTEMQLIRIQYSPHRATSHMEAMLNDVQRSAALRDAETKARMAFDEVTRQYGFKGLDRKQPDPDRIRFVHDRMTELRTAFRETDAASIGYYYYLLLIEYLQLQGRPEEASPHLMALAQLVDNNPSIRNRIRLATAYANLGANELWLHRFGPAESYFRDSLSHLRANSRNHALITEYLFYAQFYAGNTDEARDTLRQIIENPAVDQSEFRKAVRSYLMACVEFALGNYGSVRRYLRKSDAIGKDKEGWNIGSRVLGIINTIEREDMDHADALISNLRQFIREGLKDVPVRERDRLTAEVLTELRRTSYDFPTVQTTKAEALDKLRLSEGDTAWHVQIPEIICFHQWFQAKANKQRYHPDFSHEAIYS